jgi:hypothetical protein
MKHHEAESIRCAGGYVNKVQYRGYETVSCRDTNQNVEVNAQKSIKHSGILRIEFNFGAICRSFVPQAFGKMEKGKLQRARLLLMAKAGTKAGGKQRKQ